MPVLIPSFQWIDSRIIGYIANEFFCCGVKKVTQVGRLICTRLSNGYDRLIEHISDFKLRLHSAEGLHSLLFHKSSLKDATITSHFDFLLHEAAIVWAPAISVYNGAHRRFFSLLKYQALKCFELEGAQFLSGVGLRIIGQHWPKLLVQHQ